MNFLEIYNNVYRWVILSTNSEKSPSIALYPALAIRHWDTIKTFITDDFIADQPEVTKKILNSVKDSNDVIIQKRKEYLVLYDFLKTIPMELLPLTMYDNSYILQVNKETLLFTDQDFKSMRQDLEGIISFGTKKTNIHANTNQQTNDTICLADINDLDLLGSLYELIEVIEQIISYIKMTKNLQTNLISYTTEHMESDSFELQNNYSSAIAVPFEKSIEHMAYKYLGSSDRFFEIIQINRLQPPYIDNTGKQYRLLANATQDSLTLPLELNEVIHVGSKIFVGSARYNKTTPVKVLKKISNCKSLHIITSGTDLQKYTKVDLAYIKIYKPGTVQEDSFILIPTTVDLGVPDITYDTPEYQELDLAMRSFGTDIAKEDDWVIENGDIKVTGGIPAIRQAVEEVLSTAKSDNKWHPQYGIPDIIGERYMMFEQGVSFALSVRDSILTDRRFSDVIINSIASSGTGIVINIIVYIKGSVNGIPLSFAG